MHLLLLLHPFRHNSRRLFTSISLTRASGIALLAGYTALETDRRQRVLIRAEEKVSEPVPSPPQQAARDPPEPKRFAHFPRWEEFEQALERRKGNERALKLLSESARHRLFLLRRRVERGEMTEEEFQASMRQLREQILERAGKVMYGEDVALGAREEFLKRYGCVRIDQGVVETLQRLGIKKIVEMGAGRGHWAETLRSAGGFTVEAFDDSSGDHLIPEGDKTRAANLPVRRGNEETLKTMDPSFALLLVYPPPGDMALKCLRNHRGDTVIYVGESPRGANANPDFFDALESSYDLIATQDLVERFPECYERMYVFRRRRTGWFW